MALELKMPALSPTMEEGTLAKWLVKEGDSVSSGDILAEIETDKATMEFEAVDEGTIAKILVPEGTDGVKVGEPIAILAGEGESAETASASTPRADEPKSSAPEAPAHVPAPESEQPTPHQMETAARDLVHQPGNQRPGFLHREGLRWYRISNARRRFHSYGRRYAPQFRRLHADGL